jgi:hypothetical protein
LARRKSVALDPTFTSYQRIRQSAPAFNPAGLRTEPCMSQPRTFFTGLAIGVALMGCSHDDPVAPTRTRIPEQPRLDIVDAKNGGSNRFHWLPPFATSADFDGTLDVAAAPVVEICTLLAGGCPVVATSGGASLPAPSVSNGKKGGGDYFTTTWNTKSVALDPSKTYRLTVRIGGNVAGYADLDVVATSADLATVPAGFVGVVVGGQLEIDFRIVRGITRTWKGGATTKGKNADPTSGTDWANAANWAPEGVPFVLDTAVVAVMPNKPILSANTTAGRVEVRDGGVLSLGAFTLTLQGSALTAGSGRITSTTGTLVLFGAGELAGSLPTTRVTGAYALSGNVTVPSFISVVGGQLKNIGWLLRVAP